MDRKNIIYLPIALLCILLAVEIFQTILMFSYFPANDMAGFMLYSRWIEVYGFEKPIPNWGSNLVLYQSYPPGFGFMLTGIKLALGSYELAYPVSMLMIFALGLAAIFFAGNKLGLDTRERLLFFLLMYTSTLFVIEWIGGRGPEMLAWAFGFALIGLLMFYKDNKIGKKFLFSSVLFSLVIISHPFVAALTLAVFAGLFLVKPWKERGIIVLSLLISLAATAFWWLPVLSNVPSGLNSVESGGLFQNAGISAGSVFFSLFFLVSLLLYIRSGKNARNDIVFYALPAITAVLYVTRLAIFIPVASHIYAWTYQTFLFFMSCCLLLKLLKSPRYGRLAIGLIVLMSLVSVSYLAYNYRSMDRDLFNPDLQRTDNRFVAELMPQVNGSFLIVTDPLNHSHNFQELYCYSAFYYNLSTPFSWFDSRWYSNYYDGNSTISMFWSGIGKDCNKTIAASKELGASYLLAYPKECGWLVSCGLKPEATKGGACLFGI